MRIVTTLEKARKWLALKAATEQFPELSTEEVGSILDDFESITIWAKETSYVLGNVVIPTEGNRVGRVFKCVSGGTSGVTEPNWAAMVLPSVGISGSVIIGNAGSGRFANPDGSAAWTDAGTEVDLWDLDDAAAAAWEAKAAKAAHLHRTNRGGNDYDFEGIYRHCLDMANRFGGAFIK